LNPDVKIQPHVQWQVVYERARTLFRKGSLDAAIAAFQLATRLNPHVAESYHDLGVALYHAGRYEEALTCFQRAAMLNVRMASAWFNSGNTLCALKRFADAVAWFRNALALRPTESDIHYNLANTYKRLNRSHEAIAHYRAALEHNPNPLDAYNNMGTLLLKDGFLEQARSCFTKALEWDCDSLRTTYNLSMTLNRMGRIEEAIVHAQKVLNLKPDHGDALALLVSMLQQMCDWPSLAQAHARLKQHVAVQLQMGQRPCESPFLSFTLSPDPAYNLRTAKAWSHWLMEHQGMCEENFSFDERRCKKRVLTIGYLSQRFRNAATGQLMAGLFGKHDKDRFRIIAYSWGADDGSYYRRKIEHDVDRFVDIRHLSDSQAARCIYDDQVDILIDLMGWMHGNRMGILARRPAPVQVNYLGYPSTTGAPFIDYMLADRVVIPPVQKRFYTEKIVYLPDCYQANDPDPPVDRHPAERASFGLPDNTFVFCSFSNDYKIEPDVFNAWMTILKSVPDSVLWLLVRAPTARRNLRREAKMRSVDPKRLIFAEPLPKEKHLARLKLADLALDTLTVNGHTTAVDALWAGVPLITVQGSHFASRVASSILSAIGLDELVSRTLSDYEAMAIQIARDGRSIKALKVKLEMNRSSRPLFDLKRFVRNLECAYEQVWGYYLSGMPAGAERE
jgi:protein O-GlcNAc transferase